MDIRYIITLVIATAVIIIFLLNVFPALSNHSVSCEGIVFAANETNTMPAYSPFYLSSPYTPVLDDSDVCDTEITNYTVSTSGYKLGFNIAAGTYYGTYTYYDEAWIGGTNYSWVVAITILVGGIAVVLKFLGYI